MQAALRKGTLAWRRVVAAFGKEGLQEDGEIDRTCLGAIIFSDPEKRRVLNNAMSLSIGMGLYWELFKHRIKGTNLVIMDVPLLFEARLNRLTKPVIVVWVDCQTQKDRLMKRDRIPEELALQKINSQLPLDVKRDHADLVIDNTHSLEDLNEQVQNIYKQVTSPLTWKEALLSRAGVLSLVVTVFSCWFFIK
ncbi:hypothetical protein L7F22_054290 [Adiantum nelumboides]|nr:hypothetical protein [Adiantum nelumboides]